MSSVQALAMRYLSPLVGPENARHVAGMVEDALWLVLVGFIFKRVLPPLFHLAFGESQLLVFIEEALFYVGVIAFFWRAVLRMFEWYQGGDE